jgi:hypothetical protein
MHLYICLYIHTYIHTYYYIYTYIHHKLIGRYEDLRAKSEKERVAAFLATEENSKHAAATAATAAAAAAAAVVVEIPKVYFQEYFYVNYDIYICIYI